VNSIFLFAQLESKLSILDESDAISYIKPMVTALSNTANAGLSFKTSIAEDVQFSVGLKGFLLYTASSQRIFAPNSLGGLIPGGSTSTILGSKGSTLSDSLNRKYKFPNGYDYSTISHLYIHLAASYMFTEFFVKIYPAMNFADKNLILTSIGFRNNITSMLIKKPPFDLTLSIATNTFTLGDIIKSTNYSFGAQIGQTFNRLSLYAALLYEVTNGDLTYNITGNPSSGNPSLQTSHPVSTSFKGDTSVLSSVGASLKYEMFTLILEYTMARNNISTAGVMMNF